MAPRFTLRSSWAQLPHLSDRHQLAHPRRRGGEVREDPVAEHQVVERLDLDLEQQVLLERALRVDRESVQVGRDLGLVVADPLVLEQLGQAFLLGDLAEDRALAPPDRDEAESGRDGGLADAALAGHEDKPLVEHRWHDRSG